MSGESAVSLTCVHVGVMIIKVRNSESPTMIWFGGSCGVASAFLRSESTMTMRVKHVVMMMMDGARLSYVFGGVDLTLFAAKNDTNDYLLNGLTGTPTAGLYQ